MPEAPIRSRPRAVLPKAASTDDECRHRRGHARSLSHNCYDNNISRITRNVLDRFVDPAPFEA